MTTNEHVVNLVNLVDLYIKLEQSMEKYYELCAQIFPEEKFAWFGIATQEGIHAKIFQKIKTAIIENPYKWRIGKYDHNILKTLLKEMEEEIKRIESGKFVKEHVVNFAKDVESSLVESDLSNSFIYEGNDFKKMLDKISEETTEHREFMEKFMKLR